MHKDTSPDSKPESAQKAPEKLSTFIQIKKDYRWKVFAQSAFITLASIFIFGGIGWALDEWRGEGHLFLVIMLVISYPVTQFALYKRMKKFNYRKK